MLCYESPAMVDAHSQGHDPSNELLRVSVLTMFKVYNAFVHPLHQQHLQNLTITVMLTVLAFGRVATGEELLPVNHLLPGQVSEVPLHIRQPLQDALQSVPLSDYSPLDHDSGAFNKLAVWAPFSKLSTVDAPTPIGSQVQMTAVNSFIIERACGPGTCFQKLIIAFPTAVSSPVHMVLLGKPLSIILETICAGLGESEPVA